jgi:hypothetical protein
MIKREEKWTINLQLVDVLSFKKEKKANYVLMIKYVLIANYFYLAYNPFYSACFSVGTVFFFHKKSVNSVF